MDNNEILNEQSAHVLRLDRQNARFEEKNGFLTLILSGDEGKSYDRIFLHRAFPFEFPYKYISVLDSEKTEIGIIFDICELDENSIELVRCEIDKKYYSPVIAEIKGLKERYGFSYWKAVTDDGREISFTMQDTYKNIMHTGEDSIILSDVDGNRYTIKSISALSAKSYRKIEIYL